MRIQLLLLIILWGLSITVTAQSISSDKIPATVLKRIDIDFPGHQNDKWFLVSSGIYRDSFSLNGNPAVAKYDMEGKCWEQQQYIPFVQLPAIVINNFQKAFAGYQFQSAVKIETKYKDRPLSYLISLTSSKANKYGYKELFQLGYSADGISTSISKSEYKE